MARTACSKVRIHLADPPFVEIISLSLSPSSVRVCLHAALSEEDIANAAKAVVDSFGLILADVSGKA
jgi:hypothetical protein